MAHTGIKEVVRGLYSTGRVEYSDVCRMRVRPVKLSSTTQA